MNLTRSPTLYSESNPDSEKLKYPFSFYLKEHYDEDQPRSMPQVESPPIDNFPNNIATYYWIHEGENDEEDWHALCKLTNGSYVYYHAACDYTGFDCQGWMYVYSATTPETLFQYAMTTSAYELYRRECPQIVNIS